MNKQVDAQNTKLVLSYLRGFFIGPFLSKQKWAAFWRYFMTAIVLISEKVRGLDYSMVYYTKDENVHHSVYTKVPEKILKRIFADVPQIEKKAFMDVGCGKCYAVTKAAQYGFGRYGGVEYTKALFDIGVDNLKKQGLSTKDVYNKDAKEFNLYGEFDVFFFNNPFDETIIEPVVKKIFDEHCGRQCVLYYLNPSPKPRADAVERAGFKLIKQIPDKYEWYFNINVYSNGG